MAQGSIDQCLPSVEALIVHELAGNLCAWGPQQQSPIAILYLRLECIFAQGERTFPLDLLLRLDASLQATMLHEQTAGLAVTISQSCTGKLYGVSTL